MHRSLALAPLSLVAALGLALAPQQGQAPGYTDTPLLPGGEWHVHDSRRPSPVAVQSFGCGKAPSDAIVLFDGSEASLFAWQSDGGAAKWKIEQGALVAGGGNLSTRGAWGDCQLHVEWAAPTPPQSDSQGRGNSGVFFGFGRYEVQVLDSYNNKTYADGSAASVYGQYPPLVNVALAPGQWQTYDIVWTAPRFDAEGKLASKARLTVLHNGVVVQNNVELTGPTGWVGRVPYPTHPERMPIAFQDHGNPVRYRNVWVRELGNPRQKEFMLPDAVLDSYAGEYNKGKFTRLPDGLLSIDLGGVDTVLHAGSPTRFYALTTDVQVEFDAEKKLALVTVGDDFSRAMQWEKK